MPHDINIGDLVIVEDRNIVGIVLQTVSWGGDESNCHPPREDEVRDIEVRWIDGEQYWCNSEAVTVRSKAMYKKPQK